jgi:predicted ATPase
VAERLRGRARDVTVTGLGGVGKTRLALAVAHELADGFADGAVFVPLQGLDDQELVAPAIAAALDLDLTDELIETALLRAVAPLELLLVVDNVEHLLSCVPLLEDLVAAAPGGRLLATSRFSLRMRGEHEHRLDPLAFEATDDAAVELFAQCAHAAGVDLEGDDRDAARELCARLDGLPLAIELAAARLRLLGVDDLLAAMTTETALADAADDAYGQRTLRAAIDGTWQLLSEAERDAFARLAVFPGSFDSAAAIAVVGGAPDALGTIASLFDRSLLRRTRIGRQVRLSLLATLRAYALDRLDEQGELAAEQARHVHAEHYTARLVAAIPAGEAIPFRDAETANLRVALDYALTRSDRDLLARLAPAMRIAWAGASGSFVAVLSGVARLPELAATERGAGPDATT